jgi:hypothetical protein
MPEIIYGYAVGVLDRYCFFHDVLIVVSPSRQHAVAVQPDGTMEALPMWYPGEREKLTTKVDSKSNA